MKKLIIILFALPMLANAQDTLITVLGDTIVCEIKMITPQIVSYTSIDGDRIIEAINIKKKIVNGSPMLIGEDNKAAGYYKKESEIHLAGIELQQAAQTWYGGFVISLIGSVVTGTGAALINKSPTASTAMLVGGGVLTAIGGFTMVLSFSNISKAGRHLDAYRPAEK